MSDAMVTAAEATHLSLVAEVRRLQREEARLRAALERITKLECERFVFPADWHEQIEACPECQRYKSHPIQQGICDDHRKPLYARERYDEHQQRTLIYRAKDIARDVLAHEQATDK